MNKIFRMQHIKYLDDFKRHLLIDLYALSHRQATSNLSHGIFDTTRLQKLILMDGFSICEKNKRFVAPWWSSKIIDSECFNNNAQYSDQSWQHIHAADV